MNEFERHTPVKTVNYPSSSNVPLPTERFLTRLERKDSAEIVLSLY